MKYFTIIAFTLSVALATFSFTDKKCAHQPVSCYQPTEVIEPPLFSYHLDAGTNNTISKERLHSAKTIAELFPDFQMQDDVKNNRTILRDVKISIAAEHGHCSKGSSSKRNGNDLNEEQLNLLKTADYATNFKIEGNVVPNEVVPDLNKQRYFNYNMTVVPETQAEYKGGKMKFINYLKDNCQQTISKVKKGNLKSGAISFIITKYGTISSINFDSTCGYPSVDEKMMNLINDLPNGWVAATNGHGEKIQQELVFFYGLTGC